MKNICILLLVFTPIILFGQETKRIKNKVEQETYYVLESDESIKHGAYQKNYRGGSVMVNGFYKNGVKDGLWEFFDYKGVLDQKFDYSKHEIVFYNCDDKCRERKFVLSGPDTNKVAVDRPPLFIGGEPMMFDPILRNIKYPAKARENEITGTVYISFIIDKKGNAINHTVVRGVGGGCDEEALRVVKSIPDNWLPAIQNGEPVEVFYNMPINFTLK